jgi:hypothetical protein
MAVEFIAKNSFASSTGTVTIYLPTHSQGDLLLLFVESADENITTPSGWTECPSSPSGTNGQHSIMPSASGNWEQGAYSKGGGAPVSSTTDIRTLTTLKNPIMSNTDYLLTCSSGLSYTNTGIAVFNSSDFFQNFFPITNGSVAITTSTTANYFKVTARKSDDSTFTVSELSNHSIDIKYSMGGVRIAVFYKFAGASESSFTLADSGNHTTAFVASFRGVDTINPINAHANGFDTSARTNKSFPSITTTVANAMIINAIGLNHDGNSTATLSSWANANLESVTELMDQVVLTGSGGGIGASYGVKASAGSVGNTTATSAFSAVDTYITLALTPYVEPVEDYQLVAEVSQASTVVSVDSKQSNLIASVSQPSTVVTAYTKAEGATDYDLVASISQGSTISAQNRKAINLVGGISQGQTVVAQNKKSIYVLAQVSQGSTVVSHVVKYEPSYDYDLTAEIEQSSEVVASLKKQSSLLGQVSQSSEVGASLEKQTSIVGQVNQDESVESQASKHIEVVASIEQGSTVYSFVTKEELEKSISASVEQSSSVVASASKQSNGTALIEQVSVVLARISRGSTTRLIHPIRLTSSFKGAIKSQTRFNQPIRKELKF